jgi:hypothetical protein
MGATAGAIGVQAAVPSTTPVTFTEISCEHPVLALNDTLSGALATTDCKFPGFYTGYYTDFFELAVPPVQQAVVLTMRSAAFDTYLELYLRSGEFLGYDPYTDTLDNNSTVSAILAAGDYLLAPSSFLRGPVGAYTMAAVTRPAELAGCGIVWVTPGVSVSDSVTAGDCVDTTGGNHYADAVAIGLVAGTVLSVSHHSATFDAALFLRNGQGVTVASNNDSSVATTNAYIAYTVVQSGVYLLFIGTNAVGETGAYDLRIDASTTAAGSSPREPGGGRQVLQMGGLRWPKRGAGRFWSRARS